VVSVVHEAKPATVNRRLRILLVDDDPVLIKSLQDTLQEDGHVISVAHGGQAGIDAFTVSEQRAERFDVVVTDLGMPQVDGRKVAAAIKEISAATPIILLTGWGQRLIADNDTPPHVDKVLSKPPRLAELRAAFVELLP
jgi:CheY-like chemotaxis protein